MASAQTLTGSYAATTGKTSISIYGEDVVSLNFVYTTGAGEAGTTCRFRVEFSYDNATWFAEQNSSIASGVDTLTVLVHTFGGGAGGTAYSTVYNLQVVAKYMRIMVTETGSPGTAGTLSLNATLGAGVSLGATNISLGSVTVNTEFADQADDGAFTIGGTVMPIAFFADETSPDSVNEGDAGMARMTLDRRIITAGQTTDDAAIETGTRVNLLGAVLDDTASDSVDEGDAGWVRMSGDRKLMVTATSLDDTGIPQAGNRYIMAIGAVADEVTPDSVDEADLGYLRMTLDRRLLTSSQSTDDAAPETGTRANVIGALADETTPDSVDEGDVGYLRMTLARKLYTAPDQEQDAVATTHASMQAVEFKDFDGLALPNTVGTEGDVVRMAGSAAGILYTMPLTETGTATAIFTNSDVAAAGDGGFSVFAEAEDPTAMAAVTEGDHVRFKTDTAGRLIVNLGTKLDVTNDEVSTQPVEPSNVNTTAAAASLVIKASAGTLYEVSGYNSNASAQFILVHDAASLPADATVPEDVIRVPATSSFSITYPQGKSFGTGIVVYNSSTYATKTIGSADCWFSAEYI